KLARPDTNEAEILEHSKPVYKQRRTSSPEPTHAEPQARTILSPEATKFELLLAVQDGDLDRLVSLRKQVGNIAAIFDENFGWIATFSRNAATMAWLVGQGFNIHQLSTDGNNALIIAACSGHLDVVKWLTTQNCSVHQVNIHGDNALTLAAGHGHLDVVKWLATQNCSVHQVNTHGDNALTLAAGQGHLEVVKWLVTKGSIIDYHELSLGTPFSIAISTQNWGVACELIRLSADVHRSQPGGIHALFLALSHKQTSLTRLLIPLCDVSQRFHTGQTPLMVAAQENLIEVAAPLIEASISSTHGPAVLIEALPFAQKPLFRELLWRSHAYSDTRPSYSRLLADTTPVIWRIVVRDYVLSVHDKLLRLQSSLGSDGSMTLMQMRSAKMSVLAELPAWILQHPLEDIFNEASLSAESARLQNKVISFIKDDIDVLATIATGWEEEHLCPVVENLYETCLSHCLSEQPAKDIVSTLSAQGLYRPIAQRTANAWMSAWATVPQAAPLLRPVAATHIDDWDNEDLADLDPNSGEVVIRPDTVARNIGKFVDTATGTELLQAFSAALRREFDSVAEHILRINDTQLSEQSRNLYADLVGRQLHLIAQFWRATA
ncbi:MAG: ankyrin repeat domain-containing protein, partial [Betaproteobacteria bacterium]|nr:ankyrin repeat domain-containing protein [Betaproteobacteria bacterium]